MRPNFVELLACPKCGGDFDLKGDAGGDGHVMEGELTCCGCAATFPIAGGVPRLLPDDANRSAEREVIAARFGYEWNRYCDFDLAEEESSMATWFRPRSLDDLQGKTVLDAGCGMGRHAVIASRHGVARLVGMDLGHAVDAAFQNTKHLETVCIVQGDIYHPPVKEAAFDAAYSLGVLHHIPEPVRGFRALAPKVKPGGWFQVWLYGREGNGWIIYVVNPIRYFTSKMWLPLLEFLSWGLSIPLTIAAKTVYRIPGLCQLLPYHEYIRWLSKFTLRKIHAIVLDHALAPVAYYMSKQDVLDMVAVAGWKVDGLEHSRGMSWGVNVRHEPAREAVPV